MMDDEEKAIYVYGLIPTMEMEKANKGKNIPNVQLKEFGAVTAVFDYVDSQSFSEQNIEASLNNTQWAKEKEEVHQEILMLLHQQFTVIPLKFCTIFSNRKILKEMITKNYEELVTLCSFLREKEEWNLKVYCNKDKFKHFIMQNNESVEKERKEMQGISSDKHSCMKKKLDMVVNNEIEIEMKRICMDIHEEALSISIQDFVENVQGRDATEGEEVAWSSVYLINRRQINEFIEIIKQHEKAFKEMGFSFKSCGPSPVYHFVNLDIRKNT